MNQEQSEQDTKKRETSHKRHVCFSGVLFHGGVPRKQTSSFTCVICIERENKNKTNMGERSKLYSFKSDDFKIIGSV